MPPTMAEQLPRDDEAEGGFTTTRVFDAPRERVWREWTEPDAFADWFGGREAEVPASTVAMDVRPAGSANGHTVVLFHGNNFAGFYFGNVIVAPVFLLKPSWTDERFQFIPERASKN